MSFGLLGWMNRPLLYRKWRIERDRRHLPLSSLILFEVVAFLACFSGVFEWKQYST
jgi:hypothetical protein